MKNKLIFFIFLVILIAGVVSADQFSYRYPINKNTSYTYAYVVNDTHGIGGEFIHAMIDASSYVESSASGPSGNLSIKDSSHVDKNYFNSSDCLGNNPSLVYTKALSVLCFDDVIQDNTTQDCSGWENTATCKKCDGGASVACNWTTGKFGGGIDLVNRSETYMELESISTGASEPFTIEGWVYPNGTSLGYDGIFSKASEGSGWVWSFLTQNNQWRIYNPAPYFVYLTGSSYTLNTWYHLAVVFNGTHIALFVNGVIDIAPTATVIVASTQNIVIGTSKSDYCDGSEGGYGTFDGIIDEVRYYNRTLSAQELNEHYNNGINNMTSLGAEEDMVGNNAPVVIISLTPQTVYQSENIQVWINSTDDNSTIFSTQWWIYNVSNLFTTGSNMTFMNNTKSLIFTIASGNLTRGGTWNITVMSNDSTKVKNYSYSFTVLNEPATIPDNMTPANYTRDIDNVVNINCNGSMDNESDTLYYWYYGDTIDGSTALGNSTSNYTWLITQNATTYYWKCRAFDGENYSGYSQIYQIRENGLPNAIAYVNPNSPSPSDTLTCTHSTFSDLDSDAVSIQSYDWFNGVSWLGVNSSTLSSSYVISGGEFKCSMTLYDGYENVTIQSSSVSISYGCITNYAYAFTYTSSVDYLLLNFTSMQDLLNFNLTNLITNNSVYLYTNRTLVVNTTLDKSVSIYIGGDLSTRSFTILDLLANQSLLMDKSNFTFLNPFYSIDLKEEHGLSWDLEQNETISGTILSFSCNSTGYSEIDMYARNITSVKVPTKEKPARILATLTYTDNSTYYRSKIPDSTDENITMYLISKIMDTPVYITFILEDLSGVFGNAKIELRRYIGSLLLIATCDTFEMDKKVHVYLIDNERYSVYLNDGSSSRLYGWITITATETEKTIIVSGIYGVIDESPYSFITVGFRQDYNNSQVSLLYTSSKTGTRNVAFRVYNYSNNALLFEGNSTGENLTITYALPNRNGTYLLKAYFNHADTGENSIQGIMQLRNASSKVIDFHFTGTVLGLEVEKWYTIISMIMITCVAMLFGAIHSGTGAVIVSMLTAFLVFIGWLAIPYTIVSLIIVLAMLSKFSQGRKIT